MNGRYDVEKESIPDRAQFTRKEPDEDDVQLTSAEKTLDEDAFQLPCADEADEDTFQFPCAEKLSDAERIWWRKDFSPA